MFKLVLNLDIIQDGLSAQRSQSICMMQVTRHCLWKSLTLNLLDYPTLGLKPSYLEPALLVFPLEVALTAEGEPVPKEA